MSKIKIFKRDDDNVSVVNFPWNKKRANETDEEFMDRMTIKHPIQGPGFFSDKQLVGFDAADLPDRKDRDKWYPDFEDASEKIKVDHNWERKLMPVYVIREKHLDKITDFAEYRKTLKFTETDWHEQALKNLDARVEKGESDKPLIRQKLNQKIKTLKEAI